MKLADHERRTVTRHLPGEHNQQSHGKNAAPDFDMTGFDLVDKVDGTFGDLAVGVDDVGNVRVAFRGAGSTTREMDLGPDEAAELRDAVQRLVDARDDLPEDAEYNGVYDDEWFGFDQSHSAELYGNGVIAVSFGADEPDPWELHLDPPYEADPDDPDDEDTDDAQVFLDALDNALDEADARRDEEEGADVNRFLRPLDKFSVMSSSASRAYSPESGSAPASSGPKGGQFALGGGRVAAKGKQKPGRRPAKRPAKKAAPAKPAGPLGFDGKRGTGYGIQGGDPRVRTLQSVLTRLGFTDAAGVRLGANGKYGPRTTAAVKKLQQFMGLEPTGKVDEAFIAKISNAKSRAELRPQKPKPKPAAKPRARKAPARPAQRPDRQSERQQAKGIRRSVLHEMDNGICVTCDPDIARHLPGKHDQSAHGRKGARGLAKAAAKATAKKAVEAVAETAEARDGGGPGDAKPDVPAKVGGSAKRTLSQRQIDALLPKRGGWTTTTRAGAMAALKETPEGRSLLRTVDSFQSGSSVNIPRLRTDIEKVLAGDASVPAGRAEAVRILLGAIAQSDAGDRPLYRGMIAPETVDEVLARYKAGDPLDLSLASFSTDKKLAAEFSIKSAGQRVSGKKVRTPVVIEWLTGPKHALPVENLSKSRVFADEKEWIGAGRYKIVKAFPRTRQGVTTVVLQVEQVAPW